jgi:hypothetical protein
MGWKDIFSNQAEEKTLASQTSKGCHLAVIGELNEKENSVSCLPVSVNVDLNIPCSVGYLSRYGNPASLYNGIMTFLRSAMNILMPPALDVRP